MDSSEEIAKSLISEIIYALSAELAVYGRGICKSHGRSICKSFARTHRLVVLDNLNITVKQGAIYALLGPSGCGKTTLLKCIVGCQKINSGELIVLGGRPGNPKNGVPGSRIGYMPQEIGLLAEHTVKEALVYSARIAGIRDANSKFEFMAKLLDLPRAKALIKTLSCGEQRKVSLAVTLIHQPELLVLDEPTVGIDPMITTKIWDHFIRITQANQCTVIVTTHYIEEAKQATVVGIMNGGKLISETSPQDLLKCTKHETLEDAFVYLSYSKENECAIPQLMGNNEEMYDVWNKKTKWAPAKKVRCMRLAALMSKNVKHLIRNPVGILFAYLFPLIEILTFFGSIGGEPHHLRVGILNHELNKTNVTYCHEKIYHIEPTKEGCKLELLSCYFIEHLPKTIYPKVFYNCKTRMSMAAEEGHLFATMEFDSAYTEKIGQIFELNSGQIQGSTTAPLILRLDMTDRQIGEYLHYQMRKTYLKFSQNLLERCKPSSDPRLVSLPIEFGAPIYGVKEPSYEVFMVPGLLVTLAFFLQTSLTAITIILGKNDGLWDRNLASGVTICEILLSHSAVQLIFCVTQTMLGMIMVYGVFRVRMVGNYFLIFFIILLQSIAGQSFGILLAVICGNILSANYIVTGSFYPAILISGVMWPIEGMPKVLQILAKISPLTMSIQAIRNISEKGWSVSHYGVYMGLITPLLWIVLLRLVTGLYTYMK